MTAPTTEQDRNECTRLSYVLDIREADVLAIYRAGLAAGAAREREACAKVCEEIDLARKHTEHLDALDCAAAIRSRAPDG